MTTVTIDLDIARQALRYAIRTENWAAVETALNHLVRAADDRLSDGRSDSVADAAMQAPADVLRAVLVRAGKVIDRRAFSETMRAVRIYGADGAVYVEAQTAMSHAARFTVTGAAVGGGFGHVLLDHKALSAAVKGAGKRDTVTLTLTPDGDAVTVTYGAVAATLQQARVDDWVSLDFDPADAVGMFAADDTFAAAVAAAVSHASTDETRPVLCALRLEVIDGGSVRLVATDSYRLIVRDVACEVFGTDPANGEHAALQVPATVFGIATAKATGDVVVYATPNGAMLVRAGETWLMRGYDGQYPNWSQLMPESNCELTYDRSELLAALQGAARAAEKNAPACFTFSHGQTVVSVMNAGKPAFSATVSHRGSVDAWEGGRIGANAVFAASALAAQDGDTVTLGMSGPLKPMLWSSGQDVTRALVMPIRLND